MEIVIDIPEYSPSTGICYKWEGDFTIMTVVESKTIKIIANKDGLKSLANHLLNLAQDSIPSGYHMHFDETNSLEEESVDMIIEKRI